MKHYEGKGCQCEAWSYSECVCVGADWRSAREVELEEKLRIATNALRDVLECVNFADKNPDKEITLTLERVEAWRECLETVVVK